MPVLPPPPPGWEWAHTPMGIVMRRIPPVSIQPMPATVHYAPQAAPMPQQYMPAASQPVQVQPQPLAPQPPPAQHAAPPPTAPVPQPPPAPAAQDLAQTILHPTTPAVSASVPFVSNPVPLPTQPDNVTARQPGQTSPQTPITESDPATEVVPKRRTPKGGAPYLAAAGFVQAPPDDPNNPLAAALGNGAALLSNPEFVEKASAFISGDMSPDKLAELVAFAEKAGAG